MILERFAAVTALSACLFAIESVYSLNANKLDQPNSQICFKSVGYWGQNTVGLRYPKEQWEKPLKEYCQDNTWDMIIVSFMHIFYNGNPPLPGLNFAYHCENTPFPGYPYLLQCPDIAAGIKECQSKGKIVFLSMGGAAGQYSFPSDDAGKSYADLIWNMFLGGKDSSAKRPFGDVSFDGIDLDIEGGSPVGYASFVNRLRELYGTDSSRTYYIAGAPQCPFPDAYLGPTGSSPSYALGNSWFDFVFIQFYNNFCGIQNFPQNFNLEEWNNWAKQAKTQLFVGVPGASFAGGGYQKASRVQEILTDSINKFGPDKGGWFAGFMTWDIASATLNTDEGSPFGSTISAFLKSKSSCGGSSPSPPPSTPPSPPSSPTTPEEDCDPVPPGPAPAPPPPPPSPPPPPPPTNCPPSGQVTTIQQKVCFCKPENGFTRAAASSYSVKNCTNGKKGIIVSRCNPQPKGQCKWSKPKSYCYT